MTPRKMFLALLVLISGAVSTPVAADPPRQTPAPTAGIPIARSNMVEARNGRVYARPGFRFVRQPNGTVGVVSARPGGYQTGMLNCACSTRGTCTIVVTSTFVQCLNSGGTCGGTCGMTIIIGSGLHRMSYLIEGSNFACGSQGRTASGASAANSEGGSSG
jgi:hypothetical protein